MIYWVTGSYHTSARYYYEASHNPWQPTHERMPVITAPTALAIFPEELTQPARKWAERYYNLQQWSEMASGGHFAPMEEPEALVADIRRFFRERR
jgi:pimeloyl-ACP methyl ester carboxylesterase